MMRLVLASAMLPLVACSAATPAPARADGAPAAPAADLRLDAAPMPVPATAVDAAWEAVRRRAVAADADPTLPALELAGWLADGERHDEAIEVVTSALARADHPALRVALAGLQRDVGQRHRAVATLRGVVAAVPPAQVHPGLWLELAELEWLEGERAAATATLAAAERALPAPAPWREHERAVAGLRAEMAAGGPPGRLAVRDLLGNLRGSPLAHERQRCLQELIAAGGELRARAVALGIVDPDALVRARALLAAEVDRQALLELCAAGLGDHAPAVRAAAAARAVELPAATVAPWLRAALGDETDAAPFLAMHTALLHFVPDGPQSTPDELAEPAGRQRVLAAWEARWTR